MEQEKPLKEWTLGEVKAYCAAKDGNCLNDCKLTHKGITGKVCRLVTFRPAGWDLSDSPRFTPEEVERAKAIKIAFPGASAIIKVVDGSWAILHYNAPPTDGFPSIRPGQTVKISDIIGGEHERES